MEEGRGEVQEEEEDPGQVRRNGHADELFTFFVLVLFTHLLILC